MVEPDVIAEDPELHKVRRGHRGALRAYNELLEGLEAKFADVENATRGASRPGRRRGRCCRTRPRPASS